MPQAEEFSVAELGLRDAMSAYKLAGDSVAYDEAASLFANAYYLADDSGEQIVAIRAARGAAESFDQAAGRTGTAENTDLWLGRAMRPLGQIIAPTSLDLSAARVNSKNYQLLREGVQTLNVAAKLLLRRELREPSNNEEIGTKALGHTRAAYSLLRPLEKYGNAQLSPTGTRRHDQYFVNGLAARGFSELLYGSRATAARVAASAIYLAPATESSAVLNPGKLPTADRLKAVKVATARAGALAVAVVSPEPFARKLARKVV